MKIIIPELDYFLNADADSKPYPGPTHRHEDEVAFYLHTSGTTGFPKLTALSHGYNKATMDFAMLPASIGSRTTGDLLCSSGSMLAFLPFFHGAMLSLVRGRIVSKGSMIMYPSRPLTAELVLRLVKSTRPEILVIAPSHIEEICGMGESAITVLTIPQHILFGSAPLAQDAGDTLVRNGVKFVDMLGTTETGLIPIMIPPSERKSEWQYFEWHPAAGIHMEPTDSGSYELTFKRNPGRKFQAIFYTFPDREYYGTRDLFAPHPRYPNLWRYVGRKDDMIVLSNGENFNPVVLEKTLEGQSLVSGAVVTGQGRFQVGLIIESNWTQLSSDNEEGKAMLLDLLWPVIEKANHDSPAHAQVWKSKVIFANKDRPFIRSPKGTIIRKLTLEAYAQEVNAMYSEERNSDDFDFVLSPNKDLPTLEGHIRQLLSRVQPDLKNLEPNEDFFAHGVDSLQVLALANSLSQLLHLETGAKDAIISSRTVYNNGSIEALARVLQAQLTSQAQPSALHERTEQKQKRISDLVLKYTKDLPARPSFSASPDQQTVILTGASGSLGLHLLQRLRSHTNVSSVICFVRSVESEKLLRESLSNTPPASVVEVEIVQTDLSDPQFGLSSDQFKHLQSTVTTIIHNAWDVNFNKPLSAFEGTHIKGVRNFIDFCAGAKYVPRLVFISSIGAVMNWSGSGRTGPVPEQLFDDVSVAPDQGYPESKHVAERILGIAAKQCGLDCTVIRIGQIAGASNGTGIWNEREWFPCLVKSSKEMGSFPDTLLGGEKEVDWVPVDEVAAAVSEIVFADLENKKQIRVFHVINPNTASWRELVLEILEASAAAGSTSLKVVPYGEWVRHLKSHPLTPENVKKLPALKLLDTFESQSDGKLRSPKLDITKTRDVSQTMRTLRPVDQRMMRNWLSQW